MLWLVWPSGTMRSIHSEIALVAPKVEIRGSVAEGLLFWLFKGGFKVSSGTGSRWICYFGCFKEVSKSVQVLFNDECCVLSIDLSKSKREGHGTRPWALTPSTQMCCQSTQDDMSRHVGIVPQKALRHTSPGCC